MRQPTPEHGQPAGRLINFGDDHEEAYKITAKGQSGAKGCEQSIDSEFSPVLESVQFWSFPGTHAQS